MLARTPTGQPKELQVDANGRLRSAAEAAPRTTVQAVIGAAASISGALDLGNGTLARIGLPVDIGGAQGATMTFQVSDDGGATWRDLLDQAGAEVKLAGGAALVAGKSYLVDLATFVGVQFLKVRFGTSAAATAYANARNVDLTLVN